MLRMACSIVLALALAAPALAQDDPKPKVEVIKRDEAGKPVLVRIEGHEYPVCSAEKTDGCINPRDAGFDWGGTEIDYWPGKPASEIDGKLPVKQPAAEPRKNAKKPG